ncbi:MAG: tRNA 2-thiocytidine biosynthesis TtcA family protein, partial [archaeon]
MSACEKCGKESVIRLGYGPHSFCQEHFEYFFEKRVRNVTRMNQFFDNEDVIGVACSGGKDSVVVLNLMRAIMPRNTIVGISIDEGIDGYRDKAIVEAEKNYRALDIEYKIVELKKEIGNSMQEIVQKTHENGWKENSCTFCGVFRRKYINTAAREMGATKLVTGHNLDDETQSIAMNLFSGRVERLARSGAKIETHHE